MTLPTSRDCRDCWLVILSAVNIPTLGSTRHIFPPNPHVRGRAGWGENSGESLGWRERTVLGVTYHWDHSHTTPLLGPPTDPYCSSELGWWQLSKFPAKVERWMRWGEVRWEQLWGKQRTSVLAGRQLLNSTSLTSHSSHPARLIIQLVAILVTLFQLQQFL